MILLFLTSVSLDLGIFCIFPRLILTKKYFTQCIFSKSPLLPRLFCVVCCPSKCSYSWIKFLFPMGNINNSTMIFIYYYRIFTILWTSFIVNNISQSTNANPTRGLLKQFSIKQHFKVGGHVHLHECFLCIVKATVLHTNFRIFIMPQFLQERKCTKTRMLAFRSLTFSNNSKD